MNLIATHSGEGTALVLCIIWALVGALGGGIVGYGIGVALGRDVGTARRFAVAGACIVGGLVLLFCAL